MDKSAITLDRMRAFVRIAERGNLSAVARESGVGQSTITRQLRELETALGTSLLSRTTRRVTMTDEGARYYADCIRILRLVEQAGDEARAEREAPAGTIRLSCTAAFGVMQIARLLFAFQDQHPNIGIDLSLTDERIDLVRQGVDIALRLGPLTESTLRLRAIGMSERLLVASRAYVRLHGAPTHPRDLAAHQGIRMTNILGSDVFDLSGRDGRSHRVPFDGRFRTDHGLAVRAALAAGRGIAPAHRWLVDDLLADGSLVQLLPDHQLSPVPLNMLLVPERAATARVRLLVEFLIGHIRRIPGISRP